MRKVIMLISLLCLLNADIATADEGHAESDAGFLTSLPPYPPILKSPADKTTDLPDTVNVIWRSQIHASSYTIQVSDINNFSNLIIGEICTDTTIEVTDLEICTRYYWRVCASNVAGEGKFSDVWTFTIAPTSLMDNTISSTPRNYALLPAYPNPFNPRTTITYHLPETAEVSLIIYNSLGQSVWEVVSGNRIAGEYKVTWDGRDYHGLDVTSGLYICHFKSGGRTITQKLLLMR